MPSHSEALLREMNAQLHRQLAVKDQALAMAEMKVWHFSRSFVWRGSRSTATVAKHSVTYSWSYSILSLGSAAMKLPGKASRGRLQAQTKASRQSQRTSLKASGASTLAVKNFPVTCRVRSRS